VIVTSDNGPWYEGSAGDLRGRKGQSYEGGFRVPTIFWGTEHITGGVTINTPVMQIDFLSTIADLAGIKLPTDRIIDGKSLMPLITSDSKELENRPLFFFHDFDAEAIRVGKWKYIKSNSHYVWPVPLDKPDTKAGSVLATRNYTPEGQTEPVPTLGQWPALYQLDIDRGESYNVAKKYPGKVTSLAFKLNQFHESFKQNPRGWLDPTL
jgi:arylsulfatase A-like enzyme